MARPLAWRSVAQKGTPRSKVGLNELLDRCRAFRCRTSIADEIVPTSLGNPQGPMRNLRDEKMSRPRRQPFAILGLHSDKPDIVYRLIASCLCYRRLRVHPKQQNLEEGREFSETLPSQDSLGNLERVSCVSADGSNELRLR